MQNLRFRPKAAMRIAIRYFAWSPLLVLGSVFVIGIGQSLTPELHLAETAWLATIALYLFTAYGLLVARKYLGTSILTLWAFLLAVISPLLAPSCSDARRLDKLGERLGVGFWEFLAGIAVITLVTSLVLVVRYRTAPILLMPGQRRYLRWFVLCSTGVAMSLAAAAHWVTPRLHEALLIFGADFPGPTLALLEYSQSWWVLPVISAALLAYVSTKSDYTDSQLRRALNGAVVLVVALNVLAVILLYSVFGSILTMCGAV